MELEEAISKLEYELDKSKIVKKYQGKPKELFDDLDEYIKSIETVLNYLTKQEKMIEEIKSKLEEHIQHCRQEAQSSLHNEICRISLRFDESLLNIIEKKAKGEWMKC